MVAQATRIKAWEMADREVRAREKMASGPDGGFVWSANTDCDVRDKASEVTLRPAAQGDRDLARVLYLDSMKRRLTVRGRWDEAAAVARFRRNFRPHQSQVVCLDDRGIGWMQVSETTEGLHLHQIHIIEEFRNQGIGTSLIRALLQQAEAGRRSVVLNVMRGNPATSLYLRLGFRTIRVDEEKLQMRWNPDRVMAG